MKVVILAGGKGLRFYEETKNKPKPLIKIGGTPIIEHIINIYKFYGIKQFIICAGYKYDTLKKYFFNSLISKNLDIKVINTGLNTETGGRILKIKKYVKDEKNFFLTYGDGVSNINIKKLLKFHKKTGKIATVTAIKKSINFGTLKISNKKIVKAFNEKPSNDFINGGFFVFSNKVFKYIKNNKSLEFQYMPQLVKYNEMAAFIHHGFWQCLDNFKDKEILEKSYKEKLWIK